uniref:Protein binding protein n=1 Tax=Zea mays TaxID=4577 RepID=B6TVD0_MAIZE|nr:protein binding protein [Zea mays]
MESAVLACQAPTAAAAAAPGAGGDRGAEGVVMLRRSGLAACLTCPLCGRLLRDAATITECLHTFCRKCISEEFVNKEVCCCPVCSIDLGCAPLEKLRIDHSLQYVRSKVFPSKKRKVEDPEVTSPITSPIKTKVRSLSSLTKHAPQMSMQKCLRKRRTKASCLQNLPLHSTLRGSSNITKKSGGWRPLGCHFRAAKKKRSLRPKSDDIKTAGKRTDDPVDVTLASQAKTRKQITRRGNLEKRTGTKKVLILKGKQKNTKTKNTPNKRRLPALWFYLLAAFDQKGHPPLPQIPSKFLRIKDVNLPASFIQKYLAQKLNLSSETEVEIFCGGRPVSPGITLHDLADHWIGKRSKGRVRSSVSTPAAEFVLKVFYARSGAPLPKTESNQD